MTAAGSGGVVLPEGWPPQGVWGPGGVGGTGSPTKPGGSRGVVPPGKRWRAAFFALAGAGIIAAVAWALLGSRLLVVRSVSVTGTHLVPSSQVVAVADVPLGTPLAAVNSAQVARRVETIRQVASATVTKSWPDGLDITVRERTAAVAVRMAAGGYDLVDRTGVIVRWSRAKPASLPLLVTSVPGSALAGDPGVAAAAAVLAELPPWLSHSVASVAATEPGPSAGDLAASGGPELVTLYLRDGKTVVWGGADRAAEKARELAIVIRDPARYFDVSAPGTVVTR